MHIRRSPSGDGPTIYRPNELVAVRLDPPPRPVAHEPDSIPPPPRDSLLMRGQPTPRPDPDRDGLDRRHRELRLGRLVGAQSGRQGRRQGTGASGRAGADDADPHQARECRRPGAAQPGQGSLQPHRARRGADPAREAAAGRGDAQAAGRRPADAGRAQGAEAAKTPTPLQAAAGRRHRRAGANAAGQPARPCTPATDRRRQRPRAAPASPA